MNSTLRRLLLAASIFQLAAALSANEPAAKPGGAAPAHPAIKAIPPGDALRRLLDGNERFVTSRATHPNQSVDRRVVVAEAQHPIAVILTCSDSRVSPELLFDQGLGDLFVIRNAGNVIDDHVLGSIEYAVDHLDVSLVMVLGHSGCGAAKATIAGGEPVGHVKSIVESLQPSLEESRTRPGDRLENLIAGHAETVAFKIGAAEPILSLAIAKGGLRVVAARYDLGTGRVEVIKPAAPFERFKTVTSARPLIN